MPNIITHKIFAEEVLKQITKNDIKEIIERHPQIFYIGSNGPDFLFFSHIKPWESYKSHALNHLGSKMHSHHINDFYTTALRCIKEQTNKVVQENMIAYIFGHLCHWALDKTTHPYIFHRTGNCKGESAGLHHRFESMMDTMMLKKYYDIDIKDFATYEICAYDEDILKAIARIYVPVAKEVYHQEVKVFELRETLNSWYDVQKLLYDPNNTKYSILKGVETIMRKPWKISGNIIKSKIDERFDILNEEKMTWQHPCDDTIESNLSFQEMFDSAIPLAICVIEKSYGCIEYDSNVQNVTDVLQDQAYDSGMAENKEFKYFNIIY